MRSYPKKDLVCIVQHRKGKRIQYTYRPYTHMKLAYHTETNKNNNNKNKKNPSLFLSDYTYIPITMRSRILWSRNRRIIGVVWNEMKSVSQSCFVDQPSKNVPSITLAFENLGQVAKKFVYPLATPGGGVVKRCHARKLRLEIKLAMQRELSPSPIPQQQCTNSLQNLQQL